MSSRYDELKALDYAGCSLSSTPDTELQMGMGRPVCFKARGFGIETCLGCDIVSNNAADMFQQMRLVLQLERYMQHAHKGAPNPLAVGRRCEEVLEMATLGGAKAMGLGGVTGSITVGKRADIIITSCDSIRLTPAHDPVAALVLFANASDVDTVFIDGKILKREGKLADVDWNVLRGQLRESAEKVMKGSKSISMKEVKQRIGKL